MQQPAGTLIVNAKALTLDPAFPSAEAVAIEGGTIVAVGTAGELKGSFKQKPVQIIDAKGGTVLPGFSENHMHLLEGAAELDHLQLTGVRGFDALASALKNYAASRRGQQVLFAQGADYAMLGDGRLLDRLALDAVLGDQAVLVMAQDHHTAWANTLALQKGGILHGASLNPGNTVVMGQDGLATGELREMEAFRSIQTAGGFDRYRLGLSTGGEPDPYPDEATFRLDMDVMRRGLAHCARHGITSVQNMDGNLYQLQLLEAIGREDGFLPCRVKIPFHFKNHMRLEMLDKAEEMSRRFNSDFLSSSLVKVFYDGVIDSFTATIIEPYADFPEERADSLFTPQEFRDVAIEVDRRGLQIAVHAIGDGAVQAVLDGYEAAQKANGRRDSRHRIEHVEVIHPQDIHRFAELGVIASMQPPHPPGAMDFPLEPTISRIGRDRWPFSYAWRTLKDAGAHIAFASDWPVSDINPIRGVQAAVTRKRWAASDPDQRFSLMEALEAYCVEGAYAEFAEHRKGMIRSGYAADLVILSGDIEAIAPENLHTIHPIMTICRGRVTFSA